MNEAPKIVHRPHLRKSYFEKHGLADKCPGRLAILRGLHVQPHSQACRNRAETKLEKDLRVKNAKVRLQERARENQEEGASPRRGGTSRRSRTGMTEEDPDKLAQLFQQYTRTARTRVSRRESGRSTRTPATCRRPRAPDEAVKLHVGRNQL